MAYQVRRIDPFWFRHPLIAALTIGGIALGLAGLAVQANASAAGVAAPGYGTPVYIGLILGGMGALLMTKPAVSAAVGCVALLGGISTFVLQPSASGEGLPLLSRIVAALVWWLVYTALMDAVVLLAASLYNLFALSFGGVTVDLEEAADEP